MWTCIAANPPEFFVIIRKSKFEYEFLNGSFFFQNNENPTFFSFLFFFPCFVDGTVCPPIDNTGNLPILSMVHPPQSTFARVFWFCAASYNSLPVPVHVRHFLQLEGARPPPEPSPITNYKLCRLAAMNLYSAVIPCYCSMLGALGGLVNFEACCQWVLFLI